LSIFLEEYDSVFNHFIIKAPSRCYNDEFARLDKKMWGVNLHIYSLRSDSNWGIGDFGDLSRFIDIMADKGCDYVSINPIHSGLIYNPDYCSPYSPSSRERLNVIYIDVDDVIRMVGSSNANAYVMSDDFIVTKRALVEETNVQYKGVIDLKIYALKLVFSDFMVSRNTHMRSTFEMYVSDNHQSLYKSATFDAIHDVVSSSQALVKGWFDFPEQYRNYSSESVIKFQIDHDELIRFYMFTQWLCDLQVSHCHKKAQCKMKLGLIGDLAVASSRFGVDRWSDNGKLCSKISLGTPSYDGQNGQNWNLPPLNPIRMRLDSFQYFIDLVRSNMRRFSALRIDNISSLYKLWVTPNSGETNNGYFIQNCFDEFFAIISLESHLNKCFVIGEDIGYVPEELSLMMNKYNIYGYRISLYDFHKLADSESTWNLIRTHDMPTLNGFFKCCDIKSYRDDGLFSDIEFNEVLASRMKHISELFAAIGFSVKYQCSDKTDYCYESLVGHLHSFGSSSNSNLFGFYIEDWLGMITAVNAPLSSASMTKWRVKQTVRYEELAHDLGFNKFIKTIDEARN
ncbi:4-alpha-glucanotransferase, partial [Vibrio mimicus]